MICYLKKIEFDRFLSKFSRFFFVYKILENNNNNNKKKEKINF